MLCKVSVVLLSPSNSLSRPEGDALMSPGGVFCFCLSQPLCPRPPVEERHAEQGDLGVSTPGQTIVGRWEGGRGRIVARNRRGAGGGRGGVFKT